MKKETIKEILKKLFTIVIASFVCAVAIKLIVQPNQFLSGGVSGITILISRYTALKLDDAELESLLYSVLYVLFNVPIFIFGFKKLGKQFVLYSLINVLLFSILVSLIPSSWYTLFQLNLIDTLTLAILAGILSGVGSVVAFSNSFSQGGTDIISMYLSRSKGKGIGNYSLAMNAVVLILGGIVFKKFDSLIYTIIYFFISSLVVNNLYIGHKKMLIEVVTKKADDLTQTLMKESHHGCTILDAVGAYSNESKKILRIVVSSNQTKRVCEIIKDIDKESFTTIVNIGQVNGKFYIPPLK
jgi:uncharacterized membrane-anchored protein YitT (DUF2179 family)